MRKTRVLSLVVAVALVLARAAAAQSSVEVNLGFDASASGSTARIPVNLLKGESKVGKVAGEVTFPKKLLSFDSATRGQAGNEADAKVAVELLNDEQSDRSVLRIEVSATKGMPDGVLLDLHFRVSSDARVGTLELKNELRAMTVEGNEIRGGKGKDGEVTMIDSTSLITCFFFTH